jgi:hypothetical protein
MNSESGKISSIEPLVDMPGRKTAIFEIIAFCFLIVPAMAFSFDIQPGISSSFSISAFAVILNDLALTTLVMYFIWRNRESIR